MFSITYTDVNRNRSWAGGEHETLEAAKEDARKFCKVEARMGRNVRSAIAEVQKFTVKKTDENGFVFSRHFVIEAFDNVTHYRETGGALELFNQNFATIEEMREAYKQALIEGWKAF